VFPWLMVGLSVCLFVNKTNKKIVDECSQFFWGGNDRPLDKHQSVKVSG